MDFETPTIAPPSADSSLAEHFRNADRLHREGKLKESAEELKQALRINPDSPEGHYNLANVVRDAGEPALAAEGYRTAIRLAKARRHVYPDALINLGDVQLRLGQHEAAMTSFREARRLQPQRVQPRIGLSRAFELVGNLASAIKQMERAIALAPDNPALHLRLGALQHWSGAHMAALAAFDQALQLQPDFAEAHVEKGRTLLTLGRLEEGFAEAEWRWRTAAQTERQSSFTVPAWDGSQDLAGKTVLVHGSPFFSDTVMFVRYAELLAKRGAKVVLSVDEPLKRLLQTVPGVTAVLGPADPMPLHDYHVPVLSLAHLFGVQMLPQPYLKADPMLVASWQERLGATAGRRIGVAWIAAQDPTAPPVKPLALAQLLPLAATGGTLIALQQTAPEQPAPPGVVMPGLLPDFALAAGLIACLDLVITVDATVAHIAAACGKPVWLLLPVAPGWQWGLTGDTSTWYPSMTIIRQKRGGDWGEVVKRLAKLLPQD